MWHAVRVEGHHVAWNREGFVMWHEVGRGSCGME